MKQFFKTTFACVLGIFIAWFIAFFIFVFFIIASATSALTSMDNKTVYQPMPNTVFQLNLNRQVVDHVQLDPLMEISNAIEEKKKPIKLIDILNSIEKAKYNDNIKGIYLTTDGYAGSYATSTEIRQKIESFQESGKFVVAYNNHYTQNQYYLSSVADSLMINPMGAIELMGLNQQSIFFKKTLEKIGVEMQIFRVGTFKSAVEPFMLDKMSDANREQTQTYLNSMWGTISHAIADSRNLTLDEVNGLADSGIVFQMAQELTSTKLFDRTIYPTEIEAYLENMLGVEKLTLANLSKISRLPDPKRNANGTIAILYAQGEITDTKSDGIYWKETIKEIKKIQEDENINAVVLRVNSPGGSAFASEQIWKAIEELKTTKPVVTSMGSLAASGGYYISCNSNAIIAEPTTLTGSIGVFGMIPNAEGLLTEKIGLQFDDVKTNRFGSMGINKPLNPAEQKMIQHNVEKVYQTFIQRCAAGRNKTEAEIQEIAEGRVWSGENALHIGLVDKLGGLDTALAEAASLAYISSYNTVEYPKEKDFFTLLMENLDENPYMVVKNHLFQSSNPYKEVMNLLNSDSPIQARMINNITIY